ncbi:jg5391, partial [Pararge aegeria aegeria]
PEVKQHFPRVIPHGISFKRHDNIASRIHTIQHMTTPDTQQYPAETTADAETTMVE